MSRSYRFQEGDGVPIVFLHGWLGSKNSWNPVIEELESSNPRFCYDQRCHGDAPDESFHSFEELADDLHQLLTENGIERPVLAGHSMGGMVALTYATRHDNLSGLFLVGTCASTPQPAIGSPAFFRDALATMEREEWADRIVENYGLPEEIRVALKQELVEADAAVLRHSLDAMVDFDVRDDLSQVAAPAVVVAATQDRAITMELCRELADLLECPLEDVEGSHQLLWETPVAVARHLERFIARIDDGSKDIIKSPGNVRSMTRTATLKVPGGKLIRADVTVSDTIDAVELHGDFFVYPEDAVYAIQNALTSVAADTDSGELAERAAAAAQDAELVGFEPEHVAQVVRDAIEEGDRDE